MKLLTRDKFRNAVFERDNFQCVICKEKGVDAHHLIERRLWENGGYYLCNGATLCSACHLKAEQTSISVEEIREATGIETYILPKHLYNNIRYDKWGNVSLPNGQKWIGELFFDEPVQKILKPILHEFLPYVIYPKVLPISELQKDRSEYFEGQRVIITQKTDGEVFSLYNDLLYGQVIDLKIEQMSSPIKAFWKKINWEIPEKWRICGTISNDDFVGDSIWNDKNECLDWDETLVYFDILGIDSVQVVYDGVYDEKILRNLMSQNWQIRLAGSFLYKNFRRSVRLY